MNKNNVKNTTDYWS